jgi:hypothetical protein
LQVPVARKLGELVQKLKTTEINCGSWLACEGILSANNFPADTPLSQASQLPH